VKTRAVVVYEFNKPLIVDEVELDGPKKNEVLIKYKAAGLCHSDLSLIKGLFQVLLPMVPGHEGAGVVEDIGPGVTKVKPGDHVALGLVPVCGKCVYCQKGQPNLCQNKDVARSGTMLDGTYRMRKGNQSISKMSGIGCFSEYNVVNEESVIRIDKEIPFEVAALVGCAVMTGVGAVVNTAKAKWGSSVVVIGVGGVGISVVQGAVLANATQIIAIDILENKLELAKKFGATHVINASKEDPVEKVKEITDGIGVDYAFDVIGQNDITLMAFSMIRRGGSAVVVGLPKLDAKITLPLSEFPRMQKNLMGCYYGSADVRIDLTTLLKLYKENRLKIVETITKRYALDEINEAFKDMESGENIRGVILMK
jgi:S-(hydroxymethyl)glutathione dehydrogenase / alcohol dehydrogenase